MKIEHNGYAKHEKDESEKHERKWWRGSNYLRDFYALPCPQHLGVEYLWLSPSEVGLSV